MIIIDVHTGDRPYSVVVGPLEESAERLRTITRGRLVPLVTDRRIWSLYESRVTQLVDAEPIFLPEGENAKQWASLQWLIGRLSDLGVDRTTPLLALGGGSVGDLTGLAAGLFKRGCPVVHIPTTLLAQADSAVGGKTAIDAEGQKNLVGMFHQPALVLADVSFLDTLDLRQLRAGYAEIVKYGLIDDPAFFAWLEEHGAALLSGDRALREQAVARCITAKARVVEADTEDRSGVRALLNLGHTFAHAIESAAGLGEVLHGEAVSIGMVQAFDLSAQLGLCSRADSARVRRHLSACGLPTDIADARASRHELLGLMGADKKNEGGALRLVLARGIGEAFLANDVPADRLSAFLAETA